MKVFAPDYYRNFACIAGNCRHSCCVGWEIDVDASAYARYQTVDGEFENARVGAFGRQTRDILFAWINAGVVRF